jgi:hypothetical protein
MEKYTKGILFMVQQKIRTAADVAQMKRVHENVVTRSGGEEENPDYYASLCEALTLLSQQKARED